MHEMSIAAGLMDQLLAIAAANDLTVISSVSVEAGELRGVVPEALDMAFAELSRGTLAEGAALELTILPPRARCRSCDTSYIPDIDDYRCPTCGLADAHLEVGDAITLTAVVGHAEES